MILTLSSIGNPDHGQNPFLPMFGCEDNSTITVSSYNEAAEICLSYIKRNELGSGNWSGGEVYDDEGNLVALIAYNGKIIREDSPYFSQYVDSKN